MVSDFLGGPAMSLGRRRRFIEPLPRASAREDGRASSTAKRRVYRELKGISGRLK